MKEIQEWNPYYIGASCSLYRPEQFYPWLYPYGSSRRYISLWNDPEQMEDVEDKKRIMEMYPLMARRLQPYVEECCDRLEYEGSMMYDEYPDRLSLLRKSQEVWEQAQKRENFGENSPDWEQIRDLDRRSSAAGNAGEKEEKTPEIDWLRVLDPPEKDC